MTPNDLEYRREESLRDPSTAARIYLQPIAAPSILGLFGLAFATFVVAAHMAGWYGGAATPFTLIPFIAMLGGIAQFIAAMWAFKARDGLATALHGVWGSFWIAFGALQFLFLSGRIVAPVGLDSAEMGYCFVALAAITWMCMLAAFAESSSMVAVTLFLAAGSTIEAICRFTGSNGVHILAGYLLIIAALCAWYTASALMFEEAYGHPILKMFRMPRQTPSTVMTGVGEPGVIRGQ